MYYYYWSGDLGEFSFIGGAQRRFYGQTVTFLKERERQRASEGEGKGTLTLLHLSPSFNGWLCYISLSLSRSFSVCLSLGQSILPGKDAQKKQWVRSPLSMCD